MQTCEVCPRPAKMRMTRIKTGDATYKFRLCAICHQDFVQRWRDTKLEFVRSLREQFGLNRIPTQGLKKGVAPAIVAIRALEISRRYAAGAIEQQTEPC